MNKVILVGRLSKEPEIRTTTNNKSVVSFTLAVDRKYKQEGQQRADFINCVAWGKMAQTIYNYMTKGRQIAVHGHIQTRTYDAQDGAKRYVTEVIVEEFDFIGDRNHSDKEQFTPDHDPNVANGSDADFCLLPDDDDVPF